MNDLWSCPKCKEVFLVESRPHSEWRVSRTTVSDDIEMFYRAQIQAASGPICMKPECVGWLQPPESMMS